MDRSETSPSGPSGEPESNSPPSSTDARQTPFRDLHDYIALPRPGQLIMSPDGGGLVESVNELASDQSRYDTALWQIDPHGVEAPRRLHSSTQAGVKPAVLGDGSILFTSKDTTPSGPMQRSRLWRLEQDAEPAEIASTLGGLSNPVGARATSTYVVKTSRLLNSTEDEDATWRQGRENSGASAILHDGFPIRWWDSELGPDFPRLLWGRIGDDSLRDLAPDAGVALVDATYDLSPDGTTVVTTWQVREPHGLLHTGLVSIDVASLQRQTLVDETGIHHADPVIAPDNRRVAAFRRDEGTFNHATYSTVVIHDLLGGPSTTYDLTEELTPTECTWSPDSTSLYVAGDRQGRGAVVKVDALSGEVQRIVDDAVYRDLTVIPDGTWLYALRARVDCPAQPVRIPLQTEASAPEFLPSPAPAPSLPGELIEVSTTAEDGATIRGWLVLPHGDQESPFPLQQWIHGGPHMSYNNWSWTRSPWIAAAHGWAVLMPDPALSTGYGQAWLERGWPQRAAHVWSDIEALLDEVVARDDIDADRTVCIGASFGGYMANWIAGHTDRFKAIVSHAGMWALEQRHGITDRTSWAQRTLGTPAEHPQWYADNSPLHTAASITTPMLITHGNRDYRVAYSEALRGFWHLVHHFEGDPQDVPHRFLQLPSENHFVTNPGNVRIWNETVLAFLDWHVHGGEPPRLSLE